MKVVPMLMNGTPSPSRLVAEAVSTLNGVMKHVGVVSDKELPYLITRLDVVSKSPSLAVVTAYADDHNMFQFELMWLPCSRGAGGIQNDWVRYRYNTRELAHFYQDTMKDLSSS